MKKKNKFNLNEYYLLSLCIKYLLPYFLFNLKYYICNDESAIFYLKFSLNQFVLN